MSGDSVGFTKHAWFAYYSILMINDIESIQT